MGTPLTERSVLARLLAYGTPAETARLDKAARRAGFRWHCHAGPGPVACGAVNDLHRSTCSACGASRSAADVNGDRWPGRFKLKDARAVASVRWAEAHAGRRCRSPSYAGIVSGVDTAGAIIIGYNDPVSPAELASGCNGYFQWVGDRPLHGNFARLSDIELLD